ncbi:MAG: LPS export ABC transporter permease LptG [Rhodoferax sp.]|nr:LPS export ABC transporter permease LptG [Rhodoferax sp.]
MRVVRHMIQREILSGVFFATVAFLALFSFIDLVEELRWVNSADPQGYHLRHALAYVATLSVSTLYELIPITVLIGSVFVMARLAQNSEFTVLRTSGLGPWRALRVMLGLGLVFTLITFAIGDFLAPAADRAGQFLRAKYLREITIGQTGAWLREKQAYQSFAVNVGVLQADGTMRRVRVIEFDRAGRIVSTSDAKTGKFSTDDSWVLAGVSRTEFVADANGAASLTRQSLPEYRWPTTLTSEMVSVALLSPERMSTIDLFQFMRHLDANGQSSQRYEIEFWRKVFYPLSCLVMMVLALPFGYLHFRTRGISTFVFIGVMTGISFFLLNDLFGHFGNLRNWWPWLTAAAPGLIYTLLSLTAFGWLVVRR